MIRRPPRSTRTDTLFPYTTLFRSQLQLASGERKMQEYGPKTSVSTMPYPDIERLPEQLQQELAHRRNRNVFRMLMHSPDAAPGFLAMTDAARGRNARSEERRAGKAWVSKWRSRWTPDTAKKT